MPDLELLTQGGICGSQAVGEALWRSPRLCGKEFQSLSPKYITTSPELTGTQPKGLAIDISPGEVLCLGKPCYLSTGPKRFPM